MLLTSFLLPSLMEPRGKGTDICGVMTARHNCCIDAAMSVIEGRWKCTILCLLELEGPMRYSELQRKIGDISSRILSKQLKELEYDGMLKRLVFSDRKLCVSYEMTDKGHSIVPALRMLAEWGARNQFIQVIVPNDQSLFDDAGTTKSVI